MQLAEAIPMSEALSGVSEALKGAASLEAQNLTKRYGRKPVVEKVSFAVHPGEVYALTGPNGSGKTTLIRLLTGLAFPTEGTVRMMGQDLYAGGHAARKALGAVVEAPAAFYPHLSGRQNLDMHAFLTNLSAADERIREMLARMELLAVADQPVRTYSLGQRQRLGLAAAILHGPQVLILDEPTSGMDPQGIGMVHEVLAELASQGVAVLLSSHHLREVSAYAHKVGILGGGRLIEEVTLNYQGARFRVMVDQPERALAFIRTLPSVKEAVLRNQMVVFAGPPDTVMAALVRENYKVLTLEPDYFDLYEYYRERLKAV
jgi:ABC-2 type transport system ATP-binding protein